MRDEIADRYRLIQENTGTYVVLRLKYFLLPSRVKEVYWVKASDIIAASKEAAIIETMKDSTNGYDCDLLYCYQLGYKSIDPIDFISFNTCNDVDIIMVMREDHPMVKDVNDPIKMAIHFEIANVVSSVPFSQTELDNIIRKRAVTKNVSPETADTFNDLLD